MVQVIEQQWTYQDMVAKLPADSRFELRNYELIEMASPKLTHQRIVFRFSQLLQEFILKGFLGEVFLSPFDVIFSKGNVCQPDVLFVSKENQQIVTEDGVFGAPDLVLEVVSKGSVVRDYIEKKNDYAHFGVKEYWLIDPRNETIWVFTLNEKGEYDTHHVVEDGSANSKLLEGFVVEHQIIFS